MKNLEKAVHNSCRAGVVLLLLVVQLPSACQLGTDNRLVSSLRSSLAPLLLAVSERGPGLVSTCPGDEWPALCVF